MSETRMLKCDECGDLIRRTEYEIPAGWMHMSAWYHPEGSEAKYSGCADMDLCPVCVRKYRFTDDLADRCVEDYRKNVINGREARWPPCLRSRASSAACAAAGRRCPSAPIPRAIGSWPSCATTDGMYGCSETAATWACARIAMTWARGWIGMTMMTDIIEIMSDGEWRTCRQIADELRARDPMRYRTAVRDSVATKICKLRGKQGYNIEKHPDDRGPKACRYRLVGRCPAR